MDSHPKIKFAKIGWDAAVVPHLALIDGLAQCDIAFYKEAVEAGRKGLMGVFVDNERAGTIIWDLSDEPKGRVFVIDEMAAECREGLNLMAATEAFARVFAPKLDAKFMRFLTKRQGFLAKLKNRFEITYILEAEL